MTRFIEAYYPRPANVPEGWTVWNAARPIYGQMEWQREFRHGSFYAATDPANADTPRFEQRNRELDALPVEYVTPEQVTTWARWFCLHNDIDFADVECEDMLTSYALHHQ